MIISASRRTDIPAFYADWFFQRLSEGFVVTRNPFNANQLTKLRFDAEHVDAIVFWTRDPRPILPRLDELDASGIPYYFQFTITPYKQDLEPGMPADKRPIIDAFRELASRIGSERVIWRYDPVLFSDKYSQRFHEHAFERCASLLKGSCERVVISFLDMDYRNTKRISALGIREGSNAEQAGLAAFIAATANRCGMTVQSCAEQIDLASCGIEHGCCIDPDLIERVCGRALTAKGRHKDKNQRPACGCVASTDIGAYNTCLHGCAYCYANFSPGSIASNRDKHDPASPVLVGTCDADAVEFKRDQKSVLETINTAQERLPL